ncbi:MAG: hypothetical protein KDD58_03470 [Bdellovibrionales bacterium]|nr:hypothetical protein [Bdellovibrionales bacterium]
MKMEFKFFFLILLLNTACSHLKTATSLPMSTEYVFKQDVEVKSESGKVDRVNKGEKYISEEKQLLIESPGYIGVMVIQEHQRPKKIDIDLKKSTLWTSENTPIYLNTKLDSILSQVNDVQKLLMQKRAEEALNLTKSLQLEYPQVVFFRRLEASCLIVMGKVEEGKKIFEELKGSANK